MKVFVAGATGAIGQPLVRQLIAGGHEVTGMTRRLERATELREAGAEAVVCDAFDAEGLREAVAEARPEVVVHALTALPQRYRRRSDYLAPTNRVRVEGTRNLVAAATAARARRMVAESIAFAYRQQGSWVKDEDQPLEDRAEPGKSVAELERQVGETELESVALRLGWLYGPGTWYDRGGQEALEAEKRRLPIVGEGTGTFSFLHVEDAATAMRVAVESSCVGVYNVVDDEPAPMREWLPVYAQALGAKPPRRMPLWLARLAAGMESAQGAVELRGASNLKAKRELGWIPKHPSWRQGFPALLAA